MSYSNLKLLPVSLNPISLYVPSKDLFHLFSAYIAWAKLGSISFKLAMVGAFVSPIPTSSFLFFPNISDGRFLQDKNKLGALLQQLFLWNSLTVFL